VSKQEHQYAAIPFFVECNSSDVSLEIVELAARAQINLVAKNGK
jgi:hypothetical protein